MKSVVSYPERGQGGKNSYRGNCSPLLIKDIIDQFKLKSLSDYMVGSGTTEDVCNQLGLQGNYLDLNRGFDMINMDIPERPRNIFWHPPYDDIVIYSDNMYKAQKIIDQYGFDPRTSDLSRCKNWDDFVKKMNYCCLKQFASLEKNGRMFVLMGDVKKHGICHSMLTSICKPGTLENIVIKQQWNCNSDKRSYNGRFIKIVHEYMMILRKDSAKIYPVQISLNREFSMLDAINVTWRDVVAAVLEDAGRPLSLRAIYQDIEGHKKCESNVNWKAKIRQTLQKYSKFKRVSEGIWKIAA